MRADHIFTGDVRNFLLDYTPKILNWDLHTHLRLIVHSRKKCHSELWISLSTSENFSRAFLDRSDHRLDACKNLSTLQGGRSLQSHMQVFVIFTITTFVVFNKNHQKWWFWGLRQAVFNQKNLQHDFVVISAGFLCIFLGLGPMVICPSSKIARRSQFLDNIFWLRA